MYSLSLLAALLPFAWRFLNSLNVLPKTSQSCSGFRCQSRSRASDLHFIYF